MRAMYWQEQTRIRLLFSWFFYCPQMTQIFADDEFRGSAVPSLCDSWFLTINSVYLRVEHFFHDEPVSHPAW